MKKILTFLVVVLFLSACNRSQPATQPTPTQPASTGDTPVVGAPSYPNEPSYPNQPITDRPVQHAYQPQPGDIDLQRGEAFVDSASLVFMESYPIQIMLELKGSLPTPCNQLRVVVNPPNEQNQVHVEVYSVIDPTHMCAQVLEPFSANMNLGSYPTGSYTVWVNGQMRGAFDT